MNLINNIKILKHNSDYRISDVIYKSGERWEHSGNMILKNEKYNETILQEDSEIIAINENEDLEDTKSVSEKSEDLDTFLVG